MEKRLIPISPRKSGEVALGPPLVDEDRKRVNRFAACALSPATLRAYEDDWRAFETWAEVFGYVTLPANGETVAAFLTHLAEPHDGRGPCAAAYVERRLTAISVCHTLAGFQSPRDNPVVKLARKGIRRVIGTNVKKKTAFPLELVKTVMRASCERMRDVRDRALLAACFMGAFRRSEVVSIDVDGVTFRPKGVRLFLPFSKTDQEKKGRWVDIARGRDVAECPVEAIQRWMREAGLTSGALFRPVSQSGRVLDRRLKNKEVARLVKRLCTEHGLDERLFAGHSLRRGFVTAAVKAGKSERVVMRQTGHVSVAVFRTYIEDAEEFDDNASDGL